VQHSGFSPKSIRRAVFALIFFKYSPFHSLYYYHPRFELCPELRSFDCPSYIFDLITNIRSSCSRQGFGRGGNNKNNPPKSPVQAQAPAMPNSHSLSNSLTIDNIAANDPDAPKYFFQEKYAPLNVRGNFLTLCACPKNVELGEWLAHQSKR
jgi:hypothetical protein